MTDPTPAALFFIVHLFGENGEVWRTGTHDLGRQRNRIRFQGMVARLSEKGVRIKGPAVQEDPGNFVHPEDPDGNDIYLWETYPQAAPEAALEHVQNAAK